MCKELMLVIELDGITHGDSRTQKKHAIRQKAIESEGFTVIRFQDNEVLHNIKGVHQFLQNWIEAFEKAHSGGYQQEIE